MYKLNIHLDDNSEGTWVFLGNTSIFTLLHRVTRIKKFIKENQNLIAEFRLKKAYDIHGKRLFTYVALFVKTTNDFSDTIHNRTNLVIQWMDFLYPIKNKESK